MSIDDTAPAPQAPAPLTPPDCDLRGYDFMPLFGNRLFGSKLYTRALRNPRAGLAALRLWWAAWQQCPAASLPDDDEALCHLADFGTDLRGWAKVREVALHGFVKCNDGRLYHPMLAHEAREAYERRRRERERKARLRARHINENNDQGSDVPRDTTGTDERQDADVRADRTGQDRTGQDKERSKKEAERAREPEPPPRQPTAPPPAPPDARGTRLPDGWDPGEDGRAYARERGLDPGAVLEAFGDYWRARPGAAARKLDWVATWRGWCRREAERRHQAPIVARPSAHTAAARVRAAILAHGRPH